MHWLQAAPLFLALLSPAAALRAREAQEFQIPSVNAFQPSGRPGSSPYCTITFTLNDNATLTGTSCSVTYGPCYSNSDATAQPLPTEDSPASCNDTDFSFYVPEYSSIEAFTLHVNHTFDDGTGSVTHSGLTKEINRDNYPDGYAFICGASGVCNAYFQNATNPIVVAFEQD